MQASLVAFLQPERSLNAAAWQLAGPPSHGLSGHGTAAAKFLFVIGRSWTPGDVKLG
jgi:hypothetical protein